ncbi:methyltransferase-like protein 27 isoform X1 [Haliotis rufescens]|uniref:methyltransferase-like protein 27 isoform X1 n=1 Tax=Haliotis rufescens TaxID=6454 RepID=UPI00201F86F1|nr:methyltransferase-like protein 27 isoform X1 [Haliotis rufescens]
MIQAQSHDHHKLSLKNTTSSFTRLPQAQSQDYHKLIHGYFQSAMSQEFSTDATEEQKAVARDHWSKTVDGNLDNQTLYDRFSESAKDYDEVITVLNSQGQKELATTTAERFPRNRENVRILDLAAGTGKCSVELRKHGFRKIDALDASEGMLNVAREKGLYDRYTVGEIGDNTLDAATDAYDAITSSVLNVLVLKKLPIKAYEEMIRVVKKGGYVIWASYDNGFTDDNPELADRRKHVRTLEAQGKWKHVELRYFRNFVRGKDGGVSVHQIC